MIVVCYYYDHFKFQNSESINTESNVEKILKASANTFKKEFRGVFDTTYTYEIINRSFLEHRDGKLCVSKNDGLRIISYDVRFYATILLNSTFNDYNHFKLKYPLLYSEYVLDDIKIQTAFHDQIMQAWFEYD